MRRDPLALAGHSLTRRDLLRRAAAAQHALDHGAQRAVFAVTISVATLFSSINALTLSPAASTTDLPGA